MSYIYFRDLSIDLDKRHRKWAVMKTHDELKLYKNHNLYYTEEDKCKVISMKDIVLETSREWDFNFGYYIKMCAGSNTVYEIWAETLRSYELWVEYLKSK